MKWGERSGAWQKMRANEGQEFVIGGYTVADSTFDALVFGHYEGSRLLYVAPTRSGFMPPLRAQMMQKFRGLEIARLPVCKPAGKTERTMGAAVEVPADLGA